MDKQHWETGMFCDFHHLAAHTRNTARPKQKTLELPGIFALLFVHSWIKVLTKLQTRTYLHTKESLCCTIIVYCKRQVIEATEKLLVIIIPNHLIDLQNKADIISPGFSQRQERSWFCQILKATVQTHGSQTPQWVQGNSGCSSLKPF